MIYKMVGIVTIEVTTGRSTAVAKVDSEVLSLPWGERLLCCKGGNIIFSSSSSSSSSSGRRSSSSNSSSQTFQSIRSKISLF